MKITELENRIQELEAELSLLQSEKANNLSEKNYQNIIEQSSDFIMITTLEGDFIEVNDSLCYKLGYSKSEILKMNLSDIIDPVQILEQPINKEGVKNGETILRERILITKDSRNLTVEANTKMLPDGKVFAIARDITERKKEQEAQRENEEQYKVFFENAAEAIVVMDMDSQKFVSVSKSALELFKMSERELLKVGVSEVSPEYQPDGRLSSVLALKEISEAIAGGKPSFEWTHIDKEGTSLPCEVKLVRLPTKDKILIRGSIINISERNKSTEEIKRMGEEYRRLLNKLDSGIVVHAADTSIMNSNPKAAELLGLTEDQMKGKIAIDPEWKFLNEDGTTLLHENYPAIQIQRTKKELKKIICGVRRPNTNDLVWLEVTGYPVFDKNNELKEMVISFIDITALHEAQIQLTKAKEKAEENEQSLRFQNNAYERINQQLKQTNTELSKASLDISVRKVTEAALKSKTLELARANQELEHFAYVASHDLQEPLRTISNFVGMLNKKFDEKSEEERQYLRFILGATSKMQKLIMALLEFSRIGRKSSFSEVDCDKLLIEVLSEISISIQESKVTINSAKLPVLIGNELELKQLFQNLVSNAIKFRKKDQLPTIEILVEDNEIEYLFSIKDSGIGIEKRFQDKIFVIFQRLHTDTQYQGTGIGLATCQKIVNQHNGKIWIESEVGEGSTFFFTISKENRI